MSTITDSETYVLLSPPYKKSQTNDSLIKFTSKTVPLKNFNCLKKRYKKLYYEPFSFQEKIVENSKCLHLLLVREKWAQIASKLILWAERRVAVCECVYAALERVNQKRYQYGGVIVQNLFFNLLKLNMK